MAKGLFRQTIAERRQLILGDRPVQVLLFLSLPTSLMGFVQSLIPLTDGLFLNNSAGHVVASAVGYSQSIINMINTLSQGLAIAAMVMIGQANGRGDFAEVRRTTGQIIGFTLIVGVASAPLAVAAAQLIAWRLKDPGLAMNVRVYLSCYSITLPFLFLTAIFNAIKTASGQPEATFIRMVLLLIGKIIFNWLFLNVFALGVLGAALASFATYFLVGIWLYYDHFLSPGELRQSLRELKPQRATIQPLVRLSIPAIISSMTINFGFFLINTEMVHYGTVVHNAYTIANNVSMVPYALSSSIGTTITTMVSTNVAAEQERRARRVFSLGCLVSLVLSALMIAIFLPLSPTLVRLFLNTPQITPEIAGRIEPIATSTLNIFMFSIAGFGLFAVAQGAFVGLGKMRPPLVGSLLRIWLLRYLFILVFQGSMGFMSVLWGYLFSNSLTAVIFVIWLWRSDWQRNLIAVAPAQTGLGPKFILKGSSDENQ